MKQYLTGFFMAWGNFCALPCPCKRWDTNATPLMLGFLPSVGVIIGAIWAALYFAVVYFGLPYLVVAFLVAFLPFALCGFLHMDGFMDSARTRSCRAVRSKIGSASLRTVTPARSRSSALYSIFWRTSPSPRPPSPSALISQI